MAHLRESGEVDFPVTAKSYIVTMAKPKIEVGRWDEQDPIPSPSDTGAALSDLQTLAWLLDSSIQLPGSRFRIGIESLLGLIPVIGDAIGAIISTYILFLAARMGVPRVTLLRMGFNITIEAVIGLVPVAGDIFDFAWKANIKNVDLLRAHLDNPLHARRSDWLFALLFIVCILAALGLLGWGALSLGRWARGSIFG
jgi:hypothetical protein